MKDVKKELDSIWTIHSSWSQESDSYVIDKYDFIEAIKQYDNLFCNWVMIFKGGTAESFETECGKLYPIMFNEFTYCPNCGFLKYIKTIE
jgi:hypothetical protein